MTSVRQRGGAGEAGAEVHAWPLVPGRLWPACTTHWGKPEYTFESALLEVAGRSASLGLPGLSLAKWVINNTDSRTQEGQAHSKVLCKNVHRDDKIQQDDSGKPSPSPPHKPRSTPQATKSVPATRPGRADGTRLWQGHAPSRFVLLCR